MEIRYVSVVRLEGSSNGVTSPGELGPPAKRSGPWRDSWRGSHVCLSVCVWQMPPLWIDYDVSKF